MLIDIISLLHHGEMMNRLTITLDDDLYAMAQAHAVSTKTSLSKAIGNLLRQRSFQPSAAVESDPHGVRLHPLSGFPITTGDGCSFTGEDIQRVMDDEDVRQMEDMGLRQEKIERALKR